MTPDPGSSEAIALGCICPAPGDSPTLKGEAKLVAEEFLARELELDPNFLEKAFWFNANCPLHGQGNWRDEEQS